MRSFPTLLLLGLLLFPTLVQAQDTDANQGTDVKRIGIIGLDTSHSIAFAKEFNRDQPSDPALANYRVVAAYPHGSPDIESSTSRIPRYTEEIQQFGVEVVDSIETLLKKVDFVLLETNDGRPHLEQALQVYRAGKPVFIDKPAGANLAQVIAIYRAAEHYNVPMFSSSSLRYAEGAQAIRGGKIGQVLGCDAYSPCSFEPTHTDLFWYGIHGVETLYTCMGTGCQTVTCQSTEAFEVATGIWNDGRMGRFRGIRQGTRGYGGTAFGSDGIAEIGKYGGYQPLLVQIARFFDGGDTPIDPQETIELYAFMQAALASKQAGGTPIAIATVMEEAEAKASQLLDGELTEQ